MSGVRKALAAQGRRELSERVKARARALQQIRSTRWPASAVKASEGARLARRWALAGPAQYPHVALFSGDRHQGRE